MLNPDGERHYSFSGIWSENEEIASMRNGYVYALRPLNREVISRPNAEAPLAGVIDAAAAIGHPLDTGIRTDAL
ncbi:hypothetical protein ACH4SK_04175 [Streptomyces inhibens]|uniref:hypothetical protein n=1 Tax=Streptomyces inhibens TaxID=2293571 RepID=UPI00378E2259